MGTASAVVCGAFRWSCAVVYCHDAWLNRPFRSMNSICETVPFRPSRNVQNVPVCKLKVSRYRAFTHPHRERETHGVDLFGRCVGRAAGDGSRDGGECAGARPRGLRAGSVRAAGEAPVARNRKEPTAGPSSWPTGDCRVGSCRTRCRADAGGVGVRRLLPDASGRTFAVTASRPAASAAPMADRATGLNVHQRRPRRDGYRTTLCRRQRQGACR